MTNIAILDGNFGDSGKGRMSHDFSKDFDWVIRFSGGANAGHTIYRDGQKYVSNLLPCADPRTSAKMFLGSGMVIDLYQLLVEVKASKNKHIYVDPEAFIVTQAHKDNDVSLEKDRTKLIGTTKRGIGPAYVDKYSRTGTRISDLLESENKFTPTLNELKMLGVNFKHVLELKPEMSKSNLLFEAAQGVMLDLNHGTYPYVSCGDSTTAGILNSGFGFMKLDKVYGVVKCYSTRVGEGPFPTELFGEEAEALRVKGNEYGATTGRPRRIGYLDIPALQYAIAKSGIDNVIMTKLDILENFEYKICDSYEKNPVCAKDFFNAKPNFKVIKGWSSEETARDTMNYLNENYLANCKISHYTYGVERPAIEI